ncbi:MAG: Ig-like domain-containing protein, partial [Gemmatimonadales bacterium]
MIAARILRRSWLTAIGTVVVLSASACNDIGGPSEEIIPPFPSPAIISNPVAGTAASPPDVSQSDSSTTGVVYVSLLPGSFPDGEHATIRNRATGAEATAVMADGGFDPVPLPAIAGDTLDFRIELATQEGPLAGEDGAGEAEVVVFFSVVPPRRPPIVVRTDPPPGKKDVPLNATMLVVFSEPIDAARLTASSVQLLLDGEPVVGTIELADEANLTATFTPADSLTADTEYTLLITDEIEDLDGEALETPFSATFTTSSGQLEISAATSGAELDPDGYTAHVGENCISPPVFCQRYSSHPLGVNDVVRIEPVLMGAAWVGLQDVARNCSVDGGIDRYPTVVPADTARIAFAVTCVQTGELQVTVATTGIDPDPEYSLSVHGPSFDTTAVVAGNATFTISRVPPGEYDLTLEDVALHCEVTGPNPATAGVSSGGTAVVRFDVACASLGSVQLAATTTGVDLDPDGYDFSLAGERFGTSGSVAVNETVLISGVPGGDYSVTLDGVTANCDLFSPNPTTVSVPSGGTSVVTFDVTCAQAEELAVSVRSNGNTDLYRVKINGTGLTRLTTHSARDGQPAWSTDGGRIAFASTRDGNSEIYVMDGDGSGLARLTASDGDDSEPAWSPDGTKIAFRSDRTGSSEIYVMNADGTNPIRLTNQTAVDSDPAWSPDGSKIAFVSNREGNDGIYVVSADGSGVTRLTSDGVQPAWSPDGTRLAFSR